MPVYIYKALTAGGQMEQGQVNAKTADDAVAVLSQRGLVPVGVSAKRNDSGLFASLMTRGIPATQVTRLLADLSIMLNAGIRIDEALSIVEGEFDNGRLQPVVASLRTGLAGGQSFSQTLEGWPALFPPFQIAMVRVAESSGKLPMLLSRIAQERQRFEKLSARVGEALRYPAVLFAGTIAVLVFFLVGVIPQFAPIISSADKDAFIDTMFALSDFIRTNSDVLLALLAALLLGSLLAFRRPAVRSRLQSAAARLPGIGDIAKSYRAARFARLLGIMVETGIAAPSAIRLISDTIDKDQASKLRAERASDAIRQGQRFSSALEILEMPALAVRMLRIGEQSGDLVGLAYKVADFYEERMERSLSRLVGFVGPAAVTLISLLIGGMIVSMMSTLMSFNDMVR